jgi:hypothetical protein
MNAPSRKLSSFAYTLKVSPALISPAAVAAAVKLRESSRPSDSGPALSAQPANFLQLDGTWAVRYALTELAKRDLIELEYTDRPIYDNDASGYGSLSQ